MRVRPRLLLVLGLVLGALVVTAVGMVVMTQLEREHLVYTRFVRVEDLGAIAPTYPANPAAAEFAERFSGDDPIAVMRKVRDAVTCIADDPPTESPSELLSYVDDGSGLVCSGMSSVYRAALEANGFEARLVVAARFLTDPYDSHTTVEVREGERWVIYDPTFGVTFERGGRRLSAQELKESLLAEGMRDVVPVEHDTDAEYPATLDEYYMDWRVLFSNVVVRQPADSVAAKLPIVRWWWGEKRYYEVVEDHSGQNIEFLKELGLIAAVVLPVGVVALSLIALALAVYLIRARPRTDA